MTDNLLLIKDKIQHIQDFWLWEIDITASLLIAKVSLKLSKQVISGHH